MPSMIRVICHIGGGASFLIASITSNVSPSNIDGLLHSCFANCEAIRADEASTMNGLVIEISKVPISNMLPFESRQMAEDAENEYLAAASKEKLH